jgi:hypothetical protein
MTQPQTVISHGEITSLLALIRGVRGLGIGIPTDVESELQIRKTSAGDGRLSQAAHTEAISQLYTVPAAGFNKALTAAADATARLRAEQELSAVIEAASVHRLRRAVAFATAGWELAVVGLLNEAVEDYQLNDHAVHLPNLGERGFTPLSISGSSGAALDAWRTAGALLQERWALYRRLAQFEGHTIGPDSELSTNLFTVAVLGSPGSWKQAVAAADTLATFAVNADSVKPWNPLSPFIVTALHGFPLRFSTCEDAARIRQSLQHPAAVAVS